MRALECKRISFVEDIASISEEGFIEEGERARGEEIGKDSIFEENEQELN